MSNTDWMEAETYAMADRLNESLDKAYKQGVSDAWNNVIDLWNAGTFSVEWSADEMMRYAEKGNKCRADVEKIADEIGIHALYAMVREMRGEDTAADDACLIWGRNSSGDDAAQEIIEHLRKMEAVIPAERSEE